MVRTALLGQARDTVNKHIAEMRDSGRMLQLYERVRDGKISMTIATKIDREA